MAEFLLETNCLSQTDISSNINSMLRRIMEQNSSEAGSSLDRSLDCFWMKFPYERDWFLHFCKVSWDAYFKIFLFFIMPI